MKSVTCNTLVWVRDVAHEAGTTFKVVAAPKGDKEVDQTLADAWARNGWIDPSPALRAPSPSRGEGKGGAATEGA